LRQMYDGAKLYQLFPFNTMNQNLIEFETYPLSSSRPWYWINRSILEQCRFPANVILPHRHFPNPKVQLFEIVP
jgi:hypothetical protein